MFSSAMRLKRGAASVQARAVGVWLLVLLCLVGTVRGQSPPSVPASDAHILLNFKSAILLEDQAVLSDWNQANITNMCSWFGVQCNEAGRVTILKTSPLPLRGTIPESLAQLDALEQLDIDGGRFVGFFPTQLFQLPNITWINFQLNSLNVKFPPAAGPKLTHLNFRRANVNGTLPDWDWSLFEEINMERNRLTCPLPTSFIELLKQPMMMGAGCSIAMNQLWVDENSMLCGQVPIEKLHCFVAPYVTKPRNFDPDSAASWNPQFKAEFSDIQLEFDSNVAYIFAAKNTPLGRMVRRDRYIAFNFQPFAETEAAVSNMISSFNASIFNSAERLSETEFRMNGTFGGGKFTQQLLWKVSAGSEDHPNVLNNIKFSLYIQNVGHNWAGSYFHFYTNVMYHIPHSPSNGSSIRCMAGETSFLNRLESCNSSIAYLYAILQPNLDVIDVRIVVNDEINFGYNTRVRIDGVQLPISAAEAISESYFHPTAYARHIQTQSAYNDSVNLYVGPESEQFVALPLLLATPKFKTLDYDPDVSLSLLFDDLAAPGTGLAEANVAVAVAIPIGAVAVVALLVVVYKKVIFPYRQSRQASESKPIILDEEIASPALKKQSQWAEARPTAETH